MIQVIPCPICLGEYQRLLLINEPFLHVSGKLYLEFLSDLYHDTAVFL